MSLNVPNSLHSFIEQNTNKMLFFPHNEYGLDEFIFPSVYYSFTASIVEASGGLGPNIFSEKNFSFILLCSTCMFMAFHSSRTTAMGLNPINSNSFFLWKKMALYITA